MAVLAGVVSFGFSKTCGKPGFPGGYSRLSANHEWILGHLISEKKQRKAEESTATTTTTTSTTPTTTTTKTTTTSTTTATTTTRTTTPNTTPTTAPTITTTPTTTTATTKSNTRVLPERRPMIPMPLFDTNKCPLAMRKMAYDNYPLEVTIRNSGHSHKTREGHKSSFYDGVYVKQWWNKPRPYGRPTYWKDWRDGTSKCCVGITWLNHSKHGQGWYVESNKLGTDMEAFYNNWFTNTTRYPVQVKNPRRLEELPKNRRFRNFRRFKNFSNDVKTRFQVKENDAKNCVASYFGDKEDLVAADFQLTNSLK